MQKIKYLWLTSLLAWSVGGDIQVNAAQQKIITHSQIFKIKIGASRLIFTQGVNDATIFVKNPQDYPILVQGKTFLEDKKTPAPFIVTPPVSRLEEHQQSRLRVINNGNFATDRETLSWLCVAGIPPKNTDVWAHNNSFEGSKQAIIMNLEVSAQQCIKLLVRPFSLKTTPEDAAKNVLWQKDGMNLIAHNNSPYFVHFSSVTVDNHSISEAPYIPPYSTQNFKLPKSPDGTVKWVVITDSGGKSRPYTTQL